MRLKDFKKTPFYDGNTKAVIKSIGWKKFQNKYPKRITMAEIWLSAQNNPISKYQRD